MSEPSLGAASAVVVGAGGAIGAALLAELRAGGQFAQCIGLSRRSEPALDLLDEAGIAACGHWLRAQTANAPIRRLWIATGSLHGSEGGPEKSWLQLNPAYLQQQFAINAIGPMLLMKHFFPLLPKSGEVRAAFLSAKVGSVGDNRLGGWYGYRAAKAALNQAVKTASIELTRANKASICVALHPGTVASRLSEPFHKAGLDLQTPQLAAERLIDMLEGLGAQQTGGFFAYDGAELPW